MIAVDLAERTQMINLFKVLAEIPHHTSSVLGAKISSSSTGRAQALPVDILRDRLELPPRGLEAVGERIVLGQRLDAAVEQAGFEVQCQIRRPERATSSLAATKAE